MLDPWAIFEIVARVPVHFFSLLGYRHCFPSYSLSLPGLLGPPPLTGWGVTSLWGQALAGKLWAKDCPLPNPSEKSNQCLRRAQPLAQKSQKIQKSSSRESRRSPGKKIQKRSRFRTDFLWAFLNFIPGQMSKPWQEKHVTLPENPTGKFLLKCSGKLCLKINLGQPQPSAVKQRGP